MFLRIPYFFHINLSSIPSKKLNCHLSSVTNLE